MGKFHLPSLIFSAFSFPLQTEQIRNTNLLSFLLSLRYAEKQVGYVACGVFLNEKDELLRLIINSVRNDLISRNEAFQCLALEFIANGKVNEIRYSRISCWLKLP